MEMIQITYGNDTDNITEEHFSIFSVWLCV